MVYMRLKTTWTWVFVGFVAILFLYFFTRLFNLTGLPIFTDEAIYIRWSQIGMRDANWRFISLTDGKQPMFTWVMMILLKLFENSDPLFVGRLTSVIAGSVTLIGLWMLSFELFKDKRISLLTGFLYVILPITTWYDRVALYDSMAGTFAVWSLYLAIRLVRHLRLDTALLLGMTLGGGMLNKSSAFLALYFLPVTLILFNWADKKRWKNLIRWGALVVIAGLLSQVMYSVLRLSPFFHMVAQKDNVFVFTFGEWLHQPFRFLAGNLRGMFDWMREYMTLPVFIVTSIPAFTRWSKSRERWLIYFWWALPFVALANFAKILYPRYILFMIIPLLVICAYSIVSLWDKTKNNSIRFVILALCFLPSIYTTSFIVLQPKAAPIPPADRGQFIEDWPAGGGVKEVVSYLSAEAMHQRVHVFTEGTFGLLPYSIEIYLVDYLNVQITGIWPLPARMPEAIETSARSVATFFVLNETQTPPSWPMTLIGEYEKANREDHKKLRLYRINPPLDQNKP